MIKFWFTYPKTNTVSIFIMTPIWNGDVVCRTSALSCPRPDCWSCWLLWSVEWFSFILTGLVGDPTHLLISSDTHRVVLGSKMMIVIIVDTKVERFKVSPVFHVILQTSLWRGEGLPTWYLINTDLPGPRKCCAYLQLCIIIDYFIINNEKSRFWKKSPVNVRVIVGFDVREDLSGSK